MSQMLEVAAAYFTAQSWSFAPVEGREVLQLAFDVGGVTWRSFAQARDTEHQFIFYSMVPRQAPEERRAAVAEYLTRANFGLVVGNFEMDYSDGEIRYKSSVDVEGERLTPQLVENLVAPNLRAMVRYLPGLVSVLEGLRSPAEAIDDVEKGPPVIPA
jgi:hypothetical protein